MSKSREDQNIKQILEIIGDSSWGFEDVKQALKENNGSVDVVVNKILEGKISPWERVNRKKSGVEVQKLRVSNKPKAFRGRGGKAPRPRQTDSNNEKVENTKLESKTEHEEENTVSTSSEQVAEKPRSHRKASTKPIEEPATSGPTLTQTTFGFSFADAVAQNTKPKEAEPEPTEEADKPARGATRGRGGRGGFQKREPRPVTVQSEESKEGTTTEVPTETKAEVSEPAQTTPVQQPEQSTPQPISKPVSQPAPQPAPQQIQQPTQVPQQQIPQQQIPQQQIQQQIPQQQPIPQQQIPQHTPQHTPQQYGEGLQMPFHLGSQATNVQFGNFNAMSQPQDQQVSESWKQTQQPSFFGTNTQGNQRSQEKDDVDKKVQEGYGARTPMNPGMFYPSYHPNPNMAPGVQANSFPPYPAYYQQFFPMPQVYGYNQNQKQFPSYNTTAYGKNQYPNQMMQPHLQQAQDSTYQQYYTYQQPPQSQKDNEQNGHSSIPVNNYAPYHSFYFIPPQNHHDSQK